MAMGEWTGSVTADCGRVAASCTGHTTVFGTNGQLQTFTNGEAREEEADFNFSIDIDVPVCNRIDIDSVQPNVNQRYYYVANCNEFQEMALNPTKFFIKDLINKPTPIDVWVQGTIEQTVGNDILIVSDTSGRAKIVKCETADGVIDKNSLKKGVYCCIIGVAIKTKGLPEIEATKFIDLSSQPQMKTAWDDEVREAELVLQGKIKPII